MNRPLFIIGSVFILAALLWPWVRKANLFHLPGDVVIDRPGFKLFFPITTTLILSALLSAIFWLMRR